MTESEYNVRENEKSSEGDQAGNHTGREKGGTDTGINETASIAKTDHEAPLIPKYQPKHHIRIVTAASLFDGHDASINIMRRILQSTGAEVIHLGHNRSVHEIVSCAIQEDAQGIAISSYQGGHVEYFTYMMDLLKEKGASHIQVFGGGGGVIVDEEIRKLHEYGVRRIFSVQDGSKMGLQGMINFILESCDYDTNDVQKVRIDDVRRGDDGAVARAISAIENERHDVLRYDGEKLITADGEALSDSDPDSDPDSEIRGHAKSSKKTDQVPVIGITGTGGAGKSSLTDELILRFLEEFPSLRIGILSVDPSKITSGGALLGDRIRMNSIDTPRVYMRSLATRSSHSSVGSSLKAAVEICKLAGKDMILLETSGIGQGGAEITELCDIPIYVMTHEYGAASQLEKINMLDLADFVVLNKFEKKGALDALRDVRKQMQRNKGAWTTSLDKMPVYPTIASQFHDEGVNRLFKALVDRINTVCGTAWKTLNYSNPAPVEEADRITIIPGKQERYLSDVASALRDYHTWSKSQVETASSLEQIEGTIRQVLHQTNTLQEIAELPGSDTRKSQSLQKSEDLLEDADTSISPDNMIAFLQRMRQSLLQRLDPRAALLLEQLDQMMIDYRGDDLEIKIRDRRILQPLTRTSLSGLKIPRIALPKMVSKADLLRFALKENLPGHFPFTAGVFPFKREGEDPTRMFAGEGTPEQTNRRFHYLSEGMPAARLSTAFDSVTLYGEDPALRPDIYGKIGNSGVSICNLDDMKKLYSGFRLTDPTTSVSMTINGPAPMILAMFMNTAIDQEVEIALKETGNWQEAVKRAEETMNDEPVRRSLYMDALPSSHNQLGLGTLGIRGDSLVSPEMYQKIKSDTLEKVRGTVQADILKEDQAQNTCIYSTEFALRMMGDIQEYFTKNKVRNYYSVSISGYHIAEAGANPVTQAAFTLANGFTYVEYYLSRGLSIDDFAHNLSFFFSNGLDPEYAVIGRVARRIWAVAMRDRYGANERSQKLKYHIQTSGRSLHAQEIQFNDIRTTLQALMAIYDNCNSLHTNAFDEAITTPTEASVRRALAIQLIINKEMGLAKNENPLQGSYIIEELTDLVEEAILAEFDRLTERGGVLGAMERMYQRSKIQEESLIYEMQKHSGELPVIGVNTFKAKDRTEDAPVDLIRSGEREKQQQIEHLKQFHLRHKSVSVKALQDLKQTARRGGNIFEELMETVKSASLGEISKSLYNVGGRYRRNM